MSASKAVAALIDADIHQDLPEDSSDTSIDVGKGVTIEDFYAYMPLHTYIFTPTRDLWPAASVNARIAPILLVDEKGEPIRGKDEEEKWISASAWLDRNSPVEQITWAPGMPKLIKDQLIAEGGWIKR